MGHTTEGVLAVHRLVGPLASTTPNKNQFQKQFGGSQTQCKAKASAAICRGMMRLRSFPRVVYSGLGFQYQEQLVSFILAMQSSCRTYEVYIHASLDQVNQALKPALTTFPNHKLQTEGKHTYATIHRSQTHFSAR